MSTNASTIKPGMVTLANGQQVASDSREWLEECEAAKILALPTKAARLRELAFIEDKRGPAARQQLEQRIMDLWRHRIGAA